MKKSPVIFNLAPGPLLLDDSDGLFVPVEDYALQPLPGAFADLEATLWELFKRHNGVSEFDVTAFYSRRQPDLTPEAKAMLADYNQAAFTAGSRAGGLVVYYQGRLLENCERTSINPALELDFAPDCLSFCIWESRRQARAGADVSAHREAARKVSVWYENFAIKKYTVKLDSSGSAEGITFRV